MSTQVRAPTARVCERCGRAEYWDAELGAWQIDSEEGEKQVGSPHCLHEWDITGTFNPVVDD